MVVPDTSSSEARHHLWLSNPQGLIPPGTICATCGRYNARTVTCSVIAFRDNTVLLVKRGQEPSKGMYALPGGYIEWDEMLEEAARRELREETGYVAQQLHFVGVRSSDTAGDGRQNIDNYFMAEELSGDPIPEAGEVASIEWHRITDLPDTVAFNHRWALEWAWEHKKSIVTRPVFLK